MTPNFSTLKPGDKVIRYWGLPTRGNEPDSAEATVTKVTTSRIYAEHVSPLMADFAKRHGQPAPRPCPLVYWRKTGNQMGGSGVMAAWIEPIKPHSP